MIGALSGARISLCEQYRYRLWRTVGPDSNGVLFVMLNPSTADASIDDPTVRRCIGYAKSWGFSHLGVANLFALRATNPDQLWSHYDPVGPENDKHVKEMISATDLVVCAWGVPKSSHALERGRFTLEMIIASGKKPHYLHLTKEGFPQHPLYLPKNLRPVFWGQESVA